MDNKKFESYSALDAARRRSPGEAIAVNKLHSVSRVLIGFLPSSIVAAIDHSGALTIGWHRVALVAAAGLWGWGTLLSMQYARHNGWKELPRLDRWLNIVSDLIGLAQLGAMAHGLQVTNTVPARWNQISMSIDENLGAREHEGQQHPNRSTRDALEWYAKFFFNRTRSRWSDWFDETAWVVFPITMFGAGIAATLAFGSSVTLGSPPETLALLAVGASTSFGAAIAHIARAPRAHQVSMALAGGVIVALSGYLWIIDLGFTSSTPDPLGRVPGIGFGVAVIVWQLAASRDPEGERRCCRLAASVAASLGGLLILVNAWDRLEVGRIGFHDLVNLLWPLGIVTASTLAAVSRGDLGVGSRYAAVMGVSTPAGREADTDDEGVA